MINHRNNRYTKFNISKHKINLNFCDGEAERGGGGDW